MTKETEIMVLKARLRIIHASYSQKNMSKAEYMKRHYAMNARIDELEGKKSE
jgi:hypothetical protein